MQLRLASLVPSLTELLFALRLGPWVVARTGYCIHPVSEVGRIPKVGGTKDVNLAKLRRLAPTHVLVNVDENRLETVEALREFVPHLIITHPCGPEDNLTVLVQLAQHFGTLVPSILPRIEALGAELQQALALARTQAHGLTQPRKVLYLIWRDPWMTVARDTYISRMLGSAGGQTWPGVDGGPKGASRYPVVQGDEPWLAEMEEVWLSSEPYHFTSDHFAPAQSLCPRAQVRLVDGELLSWYGPRAAAGLRYAAQLLSRRT